MTLLLYIFIGLITFGALPSSFFQQDEWAIFGNFLYWQKAGLSWFDRFFFYGGVTHLIPFANIFSYFQFRLFGLTFAPYALTSIAFHIVNAFLVAILVRQLKGNKTVGILSGLFFLTNPTTHQAVTWIAAAPGTVISVTFTLATFIFFLRKQTILSVLCFIAALGFKESSVFLFLYLPALWILTLRGSKRSSWFGIVAVVLLGLFYLGVRLVFRVFGPQIPAVAQSFSQPPLPVYAYRLIAYPLKALSQSIFPQEIIISISNAMMKLTYPWLTSGSVPDPYVAQSVGSDIVSYALSLMGLGVLFFARKSSLLFLSIIFVAMSVFPLIVIPGKAGYISLFDGRHLYMTSIGVSIMLATVVILVVKKFSLLRWATVGIVATYLLYSAWYIHTAIAKQVTIAQTRKAILEKITAWYPKLPQKALVVTQSDKAYYGLPPEETILPFQSGFGNTLLVWYDMRGENLPVCFFEHKFLYELTSEDYKECEGRGFGYFRMPEDIQTIVSMHKFERSDVLFFSYSYKDDSFSKQ